MEQDSGFYKPSHNVDSLFTSIPLEEIIIIYFESIYNQNDSVKCFSQSQSNKLPSLVTKESYLISNGLFHKQINDRAIGSSLGPTLANGFLYFYESGWSSFLVNLNCLIIRYMSIIFMYYLNAKFILLHFENI